MFAVLWTLSMGDSLSAPNKSTLRVKVIDAHTVIVRGQGLPEGKLLVSADMDMPHASVACYSEFTRVALVRAGNFEVTLNPGKTSDCNFSCGPEPFNYAVTVENLDGAALAETKFACVTSRFRNGK